MKNLETITGSLLTILPNYKALAECAVSPKETTEPSRSDKPSLFPNLAIKYVRGAEPVIKLFGDSDDDSEEMSVQKWDDNTIEDFLKEHLL
ncbi:Selenoprotein F [Halotydeus destructor]|nr:Selenoprotein F [Halotydeus destructor]